MPTNRLARETSPYLRQHQHNPVDWYPWGPEAFEAARRLDRPIFLSVGYSTCYWCHVMERQCFENAAIAEEMNSRFICVKVDREERPDVDQVYMTAVQLLTHQGGWPMSVFLTPDLRPFYGGTYFPPTDQYGRPGFPRLLRALDEAWKTSRADVLSSAEQITRALRRLANPPELSGSVSLTRQSVRDLILRSTGDYDSRNGGFGGAPKFPRQTLLELLLVYSASAEKSDSSAERVRKMVLHTLDALARGGIRDQLGGGFHRYSTDAVWLVPHFEIMLYDNAMLGWCYSEAFRQTGESKWAQVARGIFDFVLREMTSGDGAFYTAFDAEVDAAEGEPYLWTRAEVRQVLEAGAITQTPGGYSDADLFCRAYGLDDGPNFADPHQGNGVPDKNVLFLPKPIEEVALEVKMATEELATRLHRCRERLLAVRKERKQPGLDTKILTSWNALMIRALAFGSKVLGEAKYRTAAERAAEFLLANHRQPDGGLLRTSGGLAVEAAPDRPKIVGFLDDYAFLAQALLELSDGENGNAWRQRAAEIIEQMLARFGEADPSKPEVDGGLFFTDQSETELIVRQKIGTDSPLPSGNGVAVRVLLELGKQSAATSILIDFASALQSQAESMCALLLGVWECLHAGDAINIHLPRGGKLPGQPSLKSLADRSSEILSATANRVGPAEIRLTLSISPGWHLSANKSAGNSRLTRTEVFVADVEARIDYPPGVSRKFSFEEEAIWVYEGTITILIHLARPIPPSDTFELTIGYQPCDDSVCLPPARKRIVIHGGE